MNSEFQETKNQHDFGLSKTSKATEEMYGAASNEMVPDMKRINRDKQKSIFKSFRTPTNPL